MTNPNNAVGTNAAFNGRTSPNAFNDIVAAFSKGIVSGWNCSPKSGMTVQLGGSASVRDVALAEDNAGNKLAINNRSGAPVEVTLSGAPSTNNRIDCIVAYVDNPSTGDDNTTDNPTACGIIAVSGTVAANPTAPTDAQIRSAITTDGATGGVAYYVILATILVGTNVTTIGSGVITQGDVSVTDRFVIADESISAAKIANAAVTSQKVDWSTMPGNYSLSEQATPYKWIDGKTIYKKTIDFGTLPNNSNKSVAHGISNLDMIIDVSFIAKSSSTYIAIPAPSTTSLPNQVVWWITGTNVNCGTGSDNSSYTKSYVTILYTKTS